MDYILDPQGNKLLAPKCSKCKRHIAPYEPVYSNVRVSYGPSVYDRRHWKWLCESCHTIVIRHAA